MRKKFVLVCIFGALMLSSAIVFSAYHHEGEKDSAKFLEVYPEKAGSKLDHCALCHSGGTYEQSAGKLVSLGSCQWCHYTYGYDGSGNILNTMNAYGKAYHDYGRNAGAVRAIENLDSDEDGYTNGVEISAGRFPGDSNDDPGKKTAPFRIYTRSQLEAMTKHTEFLLMNTSRSGDFYAEYSGVPLEDLLKDAGILDSATGIRVYAPDGWAQYHPLYIDEEPEMYHIFGTYPEAAYQYNPQAEAWCDYSAPSCSGRSHNSPISVTGGLKVILAYLREGTSLDSGILTEDNKLDGEGPYRVVVPQKNPTPPDQSSKATDQNVIWPYNYDWDHNAGASTRTVTIIRVDPLPEGTTDIDVMEAGWNYVDQEKIVIYGAINGTDSNGNGILDSEEGSCSTCDFDKDSIPDYKDTDTAYFRHAAGIDKVGLHTTKGALTNVESLNIDDPAIYQTGKPSDMTFPYGAVRFEITGLDAGASTTVSIIAPKNVPTNSKYYKVDVSGWQDISFGDNDGDTVITVTLTDGDSKTDSDGLKNGSIVAKAVIAYSTAPVVEEDDDDDDSSDCFIGTLIE